MCSISAEGNQADLRFVTMARTKLSVQRMAGIKRVISETLLGEFIEYTIENHKVIKKRIVKLTRHIELQKQLAPVSVGTVKFSTGDVKDEIDSGDELPLCDLVVR